MFPMHYHLYRFRTLLPCNPAVLLHFETTVCAKFARDPSGGFRVLRVDAVGKVA